MNTEMPSARAGVIPAFTLQRLDEGCVPAVEALIGRHAEKGALLPWDGGGGSVRPPSLNDSLFYATNELRSFVLDFSQLDAEAYDKNWEGLFGLPARELFRFFKCGVFSLLGKAIFPTLQSLILDFRDFLCRDKDDILKNGAKWARRPFLFTDILLRLPFPESAAGVFDSLADSIEESAGCLSGERRTLPDLKSIFTFKAVIEDYWSKEGADKERYYPLYLWFEITGVIPAHPTSFLLTPADCLAQDARGGWRLTLRHTVLKGRKRAVGYRIDEDYEKLSYPIPESLAKEVLRYQEACAGHAPAALGTLLSPSLRCHAMGRDEKGAGRYYSYASLVRDLHAFCSEVMGAYGYEVVYDAGTLIHADEKKVRFLHPGDTRHLSAVNLVQEGVPIQVAEVLMRHYSATQTAHYAGNLDSFAESAVREGYTERSRRFPKMTFTLEGYASAAKEGDPYVELDDGRCYSPALVAHNASDCIRSIGPDGEIGWCASCPYFRNSRQSLVMTDMSRYLSDALDDWAALYYLVDHFRKDFAGKEETLVRLLARAQASTNVVKELIERQVRG